jgi:hypothetical protein
MIPEKIPCSRVFYHASLRAIMAVLAHFFGIVVDSELVIAIHGMN